MLQGKKYEYAQYPNCGRSSCFRERRQSELLLPSISLILAISEWQIMAVMQSSA
jgi:hypothetical protein